MSGRVCYVARRQSGDRIAEVRLVGARGEESWQAPLSGAPDSMGVLAEAGQAAAWIASRAGRGGVSLLVVDVGGGECRWVTAPGTEPHIVAAAMAQTEDWGESRMGVGSWATPTPAEASVQALAPARSPGTNGGSLAVAGTEAGSDGGLRVGALAILDVSARLLVDALDEHGVDVERAVSLWHALALAWDPGAAPSGREDVVASNTPVAAIAMIEPSGRLVWAWSRAGELLAGGAMRLPGRTGAQIGRPEVGRLAADWLSWSMQLGCAPARVIVLSPPLETGPDALSPAEVGAELGRAWDGAAVDLAVHEDPVGATMQRLSGVVEDRPAPVSVEDGRQSLLMLSQRPGRAHRAMYRWVALALLVGSVALGAIAVKAWRGVGAARAESRSAREVLQVSVEEAAPPVDVIQQAVAADTPRAYLEQRLADLRRQMDPTAGMEAVKPILAELDALSYVLGNPEIRVVDMNLDSGGVILTVEVPDTPTGEALIQSMGSIYGSRVEAWIPQWQDTRGSNRSLILQGRWASETPAGGQP